MNSPSPGRRASGNLWVENTAGQLTTYTWDDDSRLVGVVDADGRVETHTYAPNGLRARKETPGGLLNFLWDQQNLLIETDASLVVQAHYTDFPGQWGGLASQRRGGTSHFYAFDGQANTRLLVAADGEVAGRYVYKAFGIWYWGRASTWRVGGISGVTWGTCTW